jgi:hypothetical protein
MYDSCSQRASLVQPGNEERAAFDEWTARIPNHAHVTVQFIFPYIKFLHVQLEACVTWKTVNVMHVEWCPKVVLSVN